MPTATSDLTYQDFLKDLTEGTMSVIMLVADSLEADDRDPRIADGARCFCWLSSILRRAIMISRYLDTIPAPAEETHGKLLAALDWVLPFFAEHKVDLASYTRMIDDELDGPLEEDDMLEDGGEEDVSGRRPLVLVAELCRDLGMALHALPPDWLIGMPDGVRLYCARAAVAGVDFGTKPRGGIGHLMER